VHSSYPSDGGGRPKVRTRVGCGKSIHNLVKTLHKDPSQKDRKLVMILLVGL
jgi:hypothetical protein